jgi:hypothetical protein
MAIVETDVCIIGGGITAIEPTPQLERALAFTGRQRANDGQSRSCRVVTSRRSPRRTRVVGTQRANAARRMSARQRPACARCASAGKTNRIGAADVVGVLELGDRMPPASDAVASRLGRRSRGLSASLHTAAPDALSGRLGAFSCTWRTCPPQPDEPAHLANLIEAV